MYGLTQWASLFWIFVLASTFEIWISIPLLAPPEQGGDDSLGLLPSFCPLGDLEAGLPPAGNEDNSQPRCGVCNPKTLAVGQCDLWLATVFPVRWPHDSQTGSAPIMRDMPMDGGRWKLRSGNFGSAWKHPQPPFKAAYSPQSPAQF